MANDVEQLAAILHLLLSRMDMPAAEKIEALKMVSRELARLREMEEQIELELLFIL